MKNTVGILGNQGQFGEFLESSLLPEIGCRHVVGVDLSATEEELNQFYKESSDIVIATSLNGYLERVKEAINHCLACEDDKTLWVISSVQAPIVREIQKMLNGVSLSFVAVHPMYGPQGYKKISKADRRQYQNVFTMIQGDELLKRRVNVLKKNIEKKLNLSVSDMTPEQHDEVTSYSQGLVYVFAEFIRNLDLSDDLHDRDVDMLRNFITNEPLQKVFLSLNECCAGIRQYFLDKGVCTQTSLDELLKVFQDADSFFNNGKESEVATVWYKNIRSLSQSV